MDRRRHESRWHQGASWSSGLCADRAGQGVSNELVADTGPQNYTDDGFGVTSRSSVAPAVARMRILEGRRRQVEERREGLREMLGRTGRADDRYSRQLHELSLESSEREVRWLNELIAAEAH